MTNKEVVIVNGKRFAIVEVNGKRIVVPDVANNNTTGLNDKTFVRVSKEVNASLADKINPSLEVG